jgi:hypothetical protein
LPNYGKCLFAYVIFVTDMRGKWVYPAYFTNPIYKELKMKINEGTIDRSLRVVAGLVLIGLAATGTVGAWGWIGIVPLLTGAVGFCPAYAIFGMSTCSMKK